MRLNQSLFDCIPTLYKPELLERIQGSGVLVDAVANEDAAMEGASVLTTMSHRPAGKGDPRKMQQAIPPRQPPSRNSQHLILK